jgi:predicted RNA binding protein YcfA (HicA-like mRNA interferase family)
MKITSITPLIVSQNAEDIIKVMEALGFEKIHRKTDIEGGQNVNVDMKDANGNRVDVASSKNVPKDLLSIKINVDDFDEAYDFFISRGFINTRGDKVTETSSSRDTYLISPSGFAITLTQHIKD